MLKCEEFVVFYVKYYNVVNVSIMLVGDIFWVEVERIVELFVVGLFKGQVVILLMLL